MFPSPGVATVDNKEKPLTMPYRQSLANFNCQLCSLFLDHPKSHINHSGERVIPADPLVDIFWSFAEPPMAQLIQEYSLVMIESQLGPTETSIAWVLSLEELTPDLIIDRGEDRNKGLCHYHLVKATMHNICEVVTAQQTFI